MSLLLMLMLTACDSQSGQSTAPNETNAEAAEQTTNTQTPEGTEQDAGTGTVAEPKPARQVAIQPEAMKGKKLRDQSFDVTFEKLGESHFITTVEQKSGKDSLHWYVQYAGQTFELPFEPLYPEAHYEMKAVAFKDMNDDGLKDIILIANYVTGIGAMGAIPVSEVQIYTQHDDGFQEAQQLEDHVNGASPYRILTIQTVRELVKMTPEEAYETAWKRLPRGKYTLYSVDEAHGSTLSVKKTSGSSLAFSLSAYYSYKVDEEDTANVGDLEGTAKRAGAEMTYHYEEKGHPDSAYDLTLSFLAPDELYVRGQGLPPFGVGVNADGIYRREKG